jgi:Cu-Zn family superoxide dismutase
MKKLLLASLFALTVVACATSGGPKAIATLSPAGGSTAAGTVYFAQHARGDVEVQVDLTGVPPGVHGLHLYAQTACSNAAPNEGYFDPAAAGHGSVHYADGLGNVTANGKGDVHARFTTHSLTIAQWVSRQSSSALDGPDGTKVPASYAEFGLTRNSVVGHAVVLRVDADDPSSQASETSGSRISCGVVAPMSGLMMNGPKPASPSHKP